MTESRTCKYPTCSEDVPKDRRKFCSVKHEVKYDHIKADAEDARRADMEDSRQSRRDDPAYDGPPY